MAPTTTNPGSRTRIFISYRKKDSSYLARALFDILSKRLSPDEIFFDRESIEGGDLWDTTIVRNLLEADVVLVLIGPSWLEQYDTAGVNRLTKTDDWVRREIIEAHNNNKRIIPILDQQKLGNVFDFFRKEIPELSFMERIQGIDVSDGLDKYFVEIEEALLKANIQLSPEPGQAPKEVVASKKANVLYHVPSRMQLGEVSTCNIRVAITNELLLRNFDADEDTKTVLNISVSDEMQAELLDPTRGKAFEITKLSPDVQPLLDDDYTEWEFDVIPLKEGRHKLRVKIVAIMEKNGKQMPLQKLFAASVDIVTEEVDQPEVIYTLADESLDIPNLVSPPQPAMVARRVAPAAPVSAKMDRMLDAAPAGAPPPPLQMSQPASEPGEVSHYKSGGARRKVMAFGLAALLGTTTITYAATPRVTWDYYTTMVFDDTAEGWEEYRQTYLPEYGAEHPRMEAASFNKATASQEVNDFESYLETYPEGESSDQAWFEIAELEGTVDAALNYMENRAQGAYSQDIWTRLADLTEDDPLVEAYWWALNHKDLLALVEVVDEVQHLETYWLKKELANMTEMALFSPAVREVWSLQDLNPVEDLAYRSSMEAAKMDDSGEMAWRFVERYTDKGVPEVVRQRLQPLLTKLPEANTYLNALEEQGAEKLQQFATEVSENPLGERAAILGQETDRRMIEPMVLLGLKSFERIESGLEQSDDVEADPDAISGATGEGDWSETENTMEGDSSDMDGGASIGAAPVEEDASWQPTSYDLERMVPIRGGAFQRGDIFGDGNDDEYVQRIQVSGFVMSKYEVTFEEYDAYCAATGRAKPDDDGWGRGDRPVIHVSWFDAIRYCNWRSEAEGLEPVYTSEGSEVIPNWSANGYRLPTETEWEFAARGGGKIKKYAGGGTWKNSVVARFNSGNQTSEVASKKASDFGLFDMTGNVWEWCWDLYSDKRQVDTTDPRGPVEGIERVFKGGDYFSDIDILRISNRGHANPKRSGDGIGFRLVRNTQ